MISNPNRQYRIAGAAEGPCACTCAGLTRRHFLRLGALAAPALLAPEVLAATEHPAKAAGAADTIFYNGTVVTVNATNTRAAALAVRGNRIVAVGGAGRVFALRGKHTRMVNLRRGALLPGFVEPHMHTCYIGQTGWTNVSPLNGTKTIDDALDKIRAVVAVTAPGEWVLAAGLDPALQAGPAPNVGLLDAIAPANPVFLQEDNGHVAHVNSAAFTKAGITNSTPNPANGFYIHDAQGNLTGQLDEIPAFTAFEATMPKLTEADFLGALGTLFNQAAQVGCTSVHDAGLGLLAGTADLALVQKAIAANPPIRYSAFLSGYVLDDWLKLGLYPGYGNARLKITGLKFWMDGSLQAETGFVRQPYLNTSSRGSADYTPAELIATMRSVAAQGWQFAIHANGDAGIDYALQTYRAVLGGKSGLAQRHRIEHCTMLHPEQIREFAHLGLSPSFLIGHTYYWGQAFKQNILGLPRANLIDQCASALRAGLRISLHSDFNTTPIDPLREIYSAVTRTLFYGGGTLNPAQRLTADQAIRAVTLDAAWQCHTDNLVGSLETGKRADLVVLSADPAAVNAHHIAKIQVRETWLDGVRRFRAG